jgi:hypothetical protein
VRRLNEPPAVESESPRLVQSDSERRLHRGGRRQAGTDRHVGDEVHVKAWQAGQVST